MTSYLCMKKQTYIRKTDMMLFWKPAYTLLVKFLSLDHFIYQRRIEIKNLDRRKQITAMK